jgi:hypothetical protein
VKLSGRNGHHDSLCDFEPGSDVASSRVRLIMDLDLCVKAGI